MTVRLVWPRGWRRSLEVKLAEHSGPEGLGHHSHGCWSLQGDKDQSSKDRELGAKVNNEGRQKGGHSLDSVQRTIWGISVKNTEHTSWHSGSGGRVVFISAKEDWLYFHTPVGSPLDPGTWTQLAVFVCYFLKLLYLYLLKFLCPFIQPASSWLFFIRNNDY